MACLFMTSSNSKPMTIEIKDVSWYSLKNNEWKYFIIQNVP